MSGQDSPAPGNEGTGYSRTPITSQSTGVSGRIFFPGDQRLEGRLEWPARGEAAARADSDVTVQPAKGGVVIAHPHPLFGGTMAQPVVFRIAKACRERGFATLRFNFRGVGGSSGVYGGREEYRDVEAALGQLEAQLVAGAPPVGAAEGPGLAAKPWLALAGYSFGSFMAALAAGREKVLVDALALVAFAVDWPDIPSDLFAMLGRFRGPVLAVCGEVDDLAPPLQVGHKLEELGLDFRLEVVVGAGHLFEGRQQEVGERVAGFFDSVFSQVPGGR